MLGVLFGIIGHNAGCENTPFFYTQAARPIL